MHKLKLLFGTVILLLSILACTISVPSVGKSTALKAGHWVNEDGTQEAAIVSFDLDDGGVITNLDMKASFGTPRATCEVTVDRVQMQVNKGGSFTISYSLSYDDVKTVLGDAVMSLGVIPEGKPYEVLHISGKSTNTTLDGTYQVNICGHTLYLSQNTGPWKAQWKSP